MLPEVFISNIKKWLGSEWQDLWNSLQGESLKAVRFHRFSFDGTSTHADELSTEVKDNSDVFAVSHRKLPAPVEFDVLKEHPVPWMKDAYYIHRDFALGRSVYHELGAYYIQEPSAMAVVSALAPRPGERVLDLCAAPGGKTTAIGRFLEGHGTLVANEIHPSRVTVLAQNLERTGVPALVTNETPQRLAALWCGEFDAVLVDAPCSGEGMFRKDPDAAIAWSPDAPEVCAARQKDILPSAISMVRPGGRLVYSTCTFNPVENEKICLWMIRNYPVRLLPLPEWPGWESGREDWADDEPTIRHTRRLWPHKGKGEGHFVALFEVTDELHIHSEAQTKSEKTKVNSREKLVKPPGWTTWLEDLLHTPLPQGWYTPWIHKNLMYTDETGGLPTAGLKVLRPGVCMATMEKNRFEPHHHLAMTFWQSVPQHRHELTESEAVRYMAGESISPAHKNGMHWLHVAGLPAGWGKSVPGRMNNLYPKGLRRSDLH